MCRFLGLLLGVVSVLGAQTVRDLPLDPQINVAKAVCEHYPGRLQIKFYFDAQLNRLLRLEQRNS